MKKATKISDSTVRRLSKYFRTLGLLMDEGVETVSSEELARLEGVTSAQIRKDLSYFGTFGRRGYGYPVEDLKKQIGKILGLNQTWNVALIGAGNIGTALIDYEEFKKQGFFVKLVVDNDPNKIGKNIKGYIVKDFKNIAEEIQKENIQISIIAVPGWAAQNVVDRLIEAGVKAILNFAPRSLIVPNGVILKNENMSIELESLSYALTNRLSRFENGD
jgi:redox-sensing transcriptional repressor